MNLNHIAADLTRQAQRHPDRPARAQLPRGLHLSCRRMERQWTLSAARIDVYPSTEEALIVARAFSVPLGTEPQWTVRTQATRLVPIDWHIITWAWLEEPAPVAPVETQPALLQQSAAY